MGFTRLNRRNKHSLHLSGLAVISLFMLSGCGLFDPPQPLKKPVEEQPSKLPTQFQFKVSGLVDPQGTVRLTTQVDGIQGLGHGLLRIKLPKGAKIIHVGSPVGLSFAEGNVVFVTGQSSLTSVVDIKGLNPKTAIKIELIDVNSETQKLATMKAVSVRAQQVVKKTFASQKLSLEEGLQAMAIQGGIRAQGLKKIDLPQNIKKSWLEFEVGDVNRDQKVSFEDAMQLLKMLVGRVDLDEEQTFNANLKDDNRVDILDFIQLVRKGLMKVTRTSYPISNVHPKNLSINDESRIIAIRNSGTGNLRSEIISKPSWVEIKSIISGVHPKNKVYSVVTKAGTTVGTTGKIKIRTVRGIKSVKVTSSASKKPGVIVPVKFEVESNEAKGLQKIVNPYGSASIDDATVVTNVPADNALIVVGLDRQGEMVSMDALTQGVHETIQFNAQRSAVGLVLTAPEMFGVAGKIRASYAKEMSRHPRYNDLVNLIRSQGRIKQSNDELEIASEIASSLVEETMSKNNINKDKLELLLKELVELQNKRVISRMGVIDTQISTQAVECAMFEGKLLDLKQDGDKITVVNRMPFAVNIYVVPAEIDVSSFEDLKEDAVRRGYISPPVSNVGVGVVDYLSSGLGNRNADFSMADLKSRAAIKNLKSGAFEVYAVYSKYDAAANNTELGYVNAGVVNTLGVINNFLDILGLGFDGSKLEKISNHPAVLGLVAAFTVAINSGDLGVSLKSYQEAQKNGDSIEMAEQAGNIMTSLALFFKDRHEQLTAIGKALVGEAIESSYSATLDAVMKRAAKNVSKAVLSKVMAGANALYSIGSLSTYIGIFASENDAKNPSFSSGFVTEVGSEREGKGCFVPKPIPEEPDPPKTPPTDEEEPDLPKTPPTDEADPDKGRGHQDGSEDGGQGSSLPLPEDSGTASSFGDPHISTFEQQVYSFQAAGEFILAQSLDDSFEIQTRYSPLSGIDMSANAAVAMRVGLDKVSIYATEKNVPSLLINDEQVPLISGQSKNISLLSGGSVSYDGQETMVTWEDGSYLIADIRKNVMGRVSVTLSPSRRGRVTGLLGNFDGNVNNDFQVRDGEILSMPVATPDIYSVFGESWRIRPEESLFNYREGESTHIFTDRTFPKDYNGLSSLTVEQRKEAEKICKDAGVLSQSILAKCTVDVGISKNPDWAYFSAGADPNVTSVAIVPLADEMQVNSTKEFTGLFFGSQSIKDRNLHWSSTGGKIIELSGGEIQYIAPSVAGIYELKAISKADPNIQKSIKINVFEALSENKNSQLKLNWIDESKDLDMHFWYPNSTPYHIFYDRKSSPSYSNCMSAILRNDLQDNQEVIDFDFRKMHFEDGKYQVHIQNQTKIGTFKEIKAGLRIETSDETLKVVIPPSGQGHWWHVLNIDARTGKIEIVNTVGDKNEPYSDTDMGCYGGST